MVLLIGNWILIVKRDNFLWFFGKGDEKEVDICKGCFGLKYNFVENSR